MSRLWTDEQVAALNAFQAERRMHPFTCPTRGTTLVATPKGWTCPCCDYTQTWAHDFMFKERAL